MLVKINVHIERDGDSFHAFCPALKGLHVDGATEEEAERNAVDAIGVYINSLIKHGDPLPIGCDENIGRPQSGIAALFKSKSIRVVPTEVNCAA